MTERQIWLTTITSVLFSSAFGAQTIAAPPEIADQTLAPWFNSLSATDGTPCCSIADCRRTSSRMGPQGYREPKSFSASYGRPKRDPLEPTPAQSNEPF
jgi:hypothetical protein